MQLSFSRIGGDARPSHHACNPMRWSLQPNGGCNQPYAPSLCHPIRPRRRGLCGARLYTGCAGCAGGARAAGLRAGRRGGVCACRRAHCHCGRRFIGRCALGPTTLPCSKPSPNLDPDSDPSLQLEPEPQPCSPNPNQVSVRSCGVSRSAPILSQTPAARPSPPRCWRAHGCYAAQARLEPQPRMRPETQPQPQPPQLPQPPPPRRRAALQSCSWEIRASGMWAPRRSRVRLTPAPCRAAAWPHSVYWFMRQSRPPTARGALTLLRTAAFWTK